MSAKTKDPKELQVFIDVKSTNEKEKPSRFNFFKRKKLKNEDDPPRSSSPVLPLVKFDLEGDFSKEQLESKNFINQIFLYSCSKYMLIFSLIKLKLIMKRRFR